MVKKKINIFIADDHPIIIEGLNFLFRDDQEFNLVGTANTTEELFDKLSYTETDLIVLDLKMPGLDWNSMVKKLLVHYPQTKILVFSAYAAPALRRTLEELGVHGFASKESDFHLLTSMIFKILDGEKAFPPAEVVHLEGSLEVGANLAAGDPFERALQLSKRERDILILIGRGYTNKRIAEQLYLSKHTVDTQRINIMNKLGLQSEEQLLRFALDNGFV